MTALPRLDRKRAAALFGDDTGAATAEYAITTMANAARLEHNWMYDPEEHAARARRHLRPPVCR